MTAQMLGEGKETMRNTAAGQEWADASPSRGAASTLKHQETRHAYSDIRPRQEQHQVFDGLTPAEMYGLATPPWPVAIN